MKRNLKLLFVTILMVTLLAGCGSSGQGGDAGADVKKKDTLTVAYVRDARVLDPQMTGEDGSSNALMPVIENLVMYNAKNELVPCLAESWEMIDNMTWKFNLRKGVKFHNGEEMKASDVVFSMKRATQPFAAQVQYIMKMIDPEGCKVVDDYTVIIKTNVPFAAFVGYMPYVGAGIVSEKAYKLDEGSDNPVGTGPYKFVSWEKGNKITYERFDDYWGEKAKFKNLVIRCIPEPNSRLIELETGGVDIAVGMTINEKAKVEANPDLKFLTANTTSYQYLAMQLDKAPFNNLKFRQAIDYALDEESIVKAVYRGSAVYVPGPVTSNTKYYYDGEPGCRYDPEKAKQLLAESGVDVKGKKFRLTVGENQPYIDMCQIIQSQLKETLGIDVEIEVMENAAYWSFISTPDKDFFIGGWGAVGFPEPDNNLFGPWAQANIPEGNSAWYKNDEVDKMLIKQRELPDGPEREALVKDIQKKMRDDAVCISLSNPLNMVGIRSYVKGFDVIAPEHQNYNSVYFE